MFTYPTAYTHTVEHNINVIEVSDLIFMFLLNKYTFFFFGIELKMSNNCKTFEKSNDVYKTSGSMWRDIKS